MKKWSELRQGSATARRMGTMGMTVRTYKLVDVFVRVISRKETGRRLWKRGEEVFCAPNEWFRGGAHFCGIPS